MSRVTKKMKRSRRQSKKQCGGYMKGGVRQQGGCNCGAPHQMGGAVNMPLAFYQDGAQMRGTYAEPTGTGLVASNNNWVRAPLSQTGGASCQAAKQQGGFSPSVMGSFLANGSRLIPAAGYMGYRMFEKAKTQKGGPKTRKGGRRGHRATRCNRNRNRRSRRAQT